MKENTDPTVVGAPANIETTKTSSLLLALEVININTIPTNDVNNPANRKAVNIRTLVLRNLNLNVRLNIGYPTTKVMKSIGIPIICPAMMAATATVFGNGE